MRIVCPACETAYDVPDQVASAGRPVRCARCRAEWTPEPPAAIQPPAEPEQEPGPVPVPEPVVEALPVSIAPALVTAPVPPATPPPAATGSSKAVIAAWVVSIIILIGMAGAAIAYRQPVMRSWPASARAYALLGYK